MTRILPVGFVFFVFLIFGGIQLFRSVKIGLGIEELDNEGRLITLEYENFYLVTCYTPNAQPELRRLEHRMAWDDAFREQLVRLDQKKPVIACGDFNVAKEEIDLKNPKANRGAPGFSDEERDKFRELLSAGFTDSFRHRGSGKAGRCGGMADILENLYAHVPCNPVFRCDSGVYRLLEHGGAAPDSSH